LFVLAPGRDTPYRLRLARPLVAFVLLGLALLGVGALTLWQHNQQLEAELAALRQTQTLTDTREGEMHTVLGLQKDKLADQATQLQAQTEQIGAIAEDLDDLKSRMSTLDRHNAQLREVLGIDAPVEGAPAQGGDSPPPPPPTATPETNSLLPGSPPGLAAPMGGSDGPPEAAPPDGEQIEQLLNTFKQDIDTLRDAMNQREQTLGELDTHTAQRVADWVTAVDEQPEGPDSPEVAAALAEAAEQAAAPPASPPQAQKPSPPPTVRQYVPAGLPYYGYISSPFGWRDSPFIKGTRTYHKGMDIVARTGTAVRATQSGTVIIAGWTNGYGQTVMIDHGKGWVTLYGHNSRIKVKVGQWVEQGQIISLSGNTGPSTGPHIHYEIRHNGTPVNPAKYR
jgi:murein DD-endopeptidase MepM/ murein hydrolase activator NlpD